MKKLIFCVSLVLAGLMTSCVDKYEEVDADVKPQWLGGSIYEELKNPDSQHLTGTFSTYLRLVDDLGYAETLNKTGSKTVFPANDEAFSRFFQQNDWGVTAYEQLSQAQKKLLLYSSMLDNAMLIGMLPNVSNGTTDVLKGRAVKHATSVNVIDTVQHIYTVAGMPKNNHFWTKFYTKGIDVVSDATRPMMVHLTREYMINNNITTAGEESDFAILTGSPYKDGSAYVFDNEIINSDVTCMNGYIHQMRNVLTNPGNMAQMLRQDADLSLFSRVVDYFAAPYYDAQTTNQYNDWAMANGYPVKDSIFQVRYMSLRSSSAEPADDRQQLLTDPNGSSSGYNTSNVLKFDPGWNGYYPASAYSTGVDHSIEDIGAMFIPNNDAMKQYFLPGGNGAYLIDIYGDRENTEENLVENLDSLHVRNPQVLTSFVKNLQMQSFAASVPSKFSTISNDASENMGMKLELLKQRSDGRYDIKIANNGVLYVLKEMVAPDEYQAVLAPSSSYPDMKIMNWAVQDRTVLGVDFRFYLLAMSANYAFFIPEDSAFNHYYVDPTTLGHRNGEQEVLHFYMNGRNLACNRYYYNALTGEVGSLKGPATIASVATQLVDILNYHTVVLESGQTAGTNHYLKTKHGGAIYVEADRVGAQVKSGAQIDNGQTPPTILNIYNEKNGKAYRIDRVIEAPRNSVYKTLKDNPNLSEFLDMCGIFDDTELMAWAGISDSANSFGTTEQDQYTIFTSTYGRGNNKVENACLDFNVKMFNTYNYTLYAPNNSAMEIAYAAGLPRETEIMADYQEYKDAADDDAAGNQAKQRVKAKLQTIRDFVRYHFQSVSLYADNTLDGKVVEQSNAQRYLSLCTDEIGMAEELKVFGGNGKLGVIDKGGVVHMVDAADTQHMVNKMARDYWFNGDKEGTSGRITGATAITTSSFCAVHEITEPFYLRADKRFD